MRKNIDKRIERRDERMARRAEKKAAKAAGYKTRYRKESRYGDFFNAPAPKPEQSETITLSNQTTPSDLFKYKGINRTAKYLAKQPKRERKAAIAAAMAFRRGAMS